MCPFYQLGKPAKDTLDETTRFVNEWVRDSPLKNIGQSFAAKTKQSFKVQRP